MHFYRTTGDALVDADPVWDGTLSEAHASLKAIKHMLEPRIELFDLPTDKKGILAMLNRQVDSEYLSNIGGGVLRTWCLTDRGGLKEVPNGE